jgi:hypothetical protein
VGVFALLAVLALGAGGSASAQPASPTRTSTVRTGPLVAPKTSKIADCQYLTEVTVADPTLAGYATKRGNVVLRALLTDGAALCGFLYRGDGIDKRHVLGRHRARGTESKAHQPSSVTTFNTLESGALPYAVPF